MDQQTIENFTPLSDRMLVSLEDRETETDLHVPEGASARQGNGRVGEVVATADNATESNGTSLTEIEVGDQVLFPESIGREMPGSESEHRLIRQSNILALFGG